MLIREVNTDPVYSGTDIEYSFSYILSLGNFSGGGVDHHDKQTQTDEKSPTLSVVFDADQFLAGPFFHASPVEALEPFLVST